MPVSADDFRAGMRGLAASVSVVTSANGGEKAGLTATAVMSLTANPPQIGVAVNKRNSSLEVIRRAGVFAVNVLAQDQMSVARIFSGVAGVRGEARFATGVWCSWITGAPVLENAKVNFDCRLASTLELSTHVLLVGLIEAARCSAGENGLLYVDGCYGAFFRRGRQREFEPLTGLTGALYNA